MARGSGAIGCCLMMKIEMPVVGGWLTFALLVWVKVGSPCGVWVKKDDGKITSFYIRPPDPTIREMNTDMVN